MRRPCRPGGARGGDFGRRIADLARPDLGAGRRIGRDQRSATASAPRPATVRQAAGASCSIASPIRRTALTLSSNGCQSSRSAIADQIASTSSICIEQGADPTNRDAIAAARVLQRAGECAERHRTDRAPRRDRGRRASRRRCGRSAAPRVASAGSVRRRARGRSSPGATPSAAHQGLDQRASRSARSIAASISDRAGASATSDRQPANCARSQWIASGWRAEGVEPVMVEISGGEFRLPLGREAPRTVVEALAGHVDIVAVEHAVDEARGEIGGGEPRGRRADEIEQPQCILAVIAAGLLAVEILEAVADELLDVVGLRRRRRGAGMCRCGCGRG